VEDARNGRFDSALPSLRALVESAPNELRWRYDLVAVLSWANRHVEARDAARNLRLGVNTPSYVLAAIGKSALEAGDAARSLQAWNRLLRRQPNNADTLLGVALAQLAGADPKPARVTLQRLLAMAGSNGPQKQAIAEALRARGHADRATTFDGGTPALPQPQSQRQIGVTDPAPAAPVVDARPVTEIVIAPTTPTATATSTATMSPASATAPALADLQELNGLAIRKASQHLEQDYSAARYGPIDQALSDNAALIERARAAGDQAVLERLQWDRVVALQRRGALLTAIGLHDELSDGGRKQTPAWERNAVADAWLALRHPNKARAMYQSLLTDDPHNQNLQIALAYAELESERLDAAMDVANRLVTNHPDSLGAARTQSTMLRFTDRLAEAQGALQKLRTAYPDDAGLWLDEADLLMARGLPRAAQVLYARVLAVAPDNLNARVGVVNALWAQGQLIDADRLRLALVEQAPEHLGVRRLQRAWERHLRPILVTDVTSGMGFGVVSGNDDLVWESAIYSGQIANTWRLFGTHHRSQAAFGGNEAAHERIGFGGEWTRRDWQATLEANHDIRNARAASWATSARWQIDDQWSVRGSYESQTNDFPLKGRVPGAQPGAPYWLHAAKSNLGVNWRQNESRRMSGAISWYDFNDGNQRVALNTSYVDRLVSRNGRTLDLTLSVYGSRNTLRDAVYFNPFHDAALAATLTWDWLTWRQYERTFNQRLTVTLGNYRQYSYGSPRFDRVVDYGWNLFQDVRYEHEWRWGPDRSTRYGIGARRFPYDGIHETKGYVYLHHEWRF